MVSEFHPGFPNEHSVDEVRAKQVEKIEDEETQDIALLPDLIRDYVVRLRDLRNKKIILQQEIDQYKIDKNMYEREEGTDLQDEELVTGWEDRRRELLEDEFATYNRLDKINNENPAVRDVYNEYLFRSKKRSNILRPQDLLEN